MLTNASENLMYEALCKIAKEAKEEWVSDLASTVVTKVGLQDVDKSLVYKYRGSSLVKNILQEHPYRENMSNQEAAHILNKYQEEARKITDALDIECTTIRAMGENVYLSATTKQRAEWHVLKAIHEASTTPRAWAKTKLRTVWDLTRFVASPEWDEMINRLKANE